VRAAKEREFYLTVGGCQTTIFGLTTVGALSLDAVVRGVQIGKGYIKPMKTLIQCDFDGTIIEQDVTSILLAKFADQVSRQLLADYRAGQISVEVFVMKGYAAVKADERTLLKEIEGKVELRAARTCFAESPRVASEQIHKDGA
jgi:uncharacterized protein YqgV (UPF0045/DUF77 family)